MAQIELSPRSGRQTGEVPWRWDIRMGREPMPHSYTSIMVHVVFSAKDRKPQLDTALEERLYPYLGGILRELGGKLFTVNGVSVARYAGSIHDTHRSPG
jgi:hypothetical protein